MPLRVLKSSQAHLMDETINRNHYDSLSKREVQVLVLVSKGVSSQHIADALFLSRNTVYNHRKNMLRKTGLKNSAELIRYGMLTGLIGN
ncbi:MAG: DNA-binding CsgD family transcriptional regulator [Bacteroidia bacterium]|jgi:DNA-binding CsgD family transcriptional regulator